MATEQQALKVRSGIEEPRRADDHDARGQLLAGIPVAERRLELAGGCRPPCWRAATGRRSCFCTAPGESSVNWRWVLPQLVETHRVIAPDLPAHGSRDCGVDPIVEQPDALLDALRAELEIGSPVHKRKRS